MPALNRFYAGWQARPLLDIPRAAIEAYARHHRLSWEEDHSNRDLRFDRNYLRHKVMPLLTERWPAAGATLSRAARLSGEMLTLAREAAEEDLVQARRQGEDVLSLEVLRRFDSIRLRNLLRHWIVSSGAPLPNSRKLQRIEREAVNGRPDANPLIAWRGWEVRRFRGRLYLGPALPPFEVPAPLTWDQQGPLLLPAGLGRLSVERGSGGIAADRWSGARVEIRFRQGGERCIPAGQAHHRPLKKLLQEWAVPTWIRPRLPLVYLDGELAAIPGYLVCHPFAAGADSESVLIRWDGAEPAG
jgi:tRNA(Ile)-lysidine synthase